MRKGFTLIELLAVIVILAIIALIATPIVLEIIEDSKESATLRSAEFYLDGVEHSIATSILKKQTINDGQYSIMKDGNICIGKLEDSLCKEDESIQGSGYVLEVNVKGEKPKEGTITISSGEVSEIELTISNKEIWKNPTTGNLVYKLAPGLYDEKAELIMSWDELNTIALEETKSLELEYLETPADFETVIENGGFVVDDTNVSGIAAKIIDSIAGAYKLVIDDSVTNIGPEAFWNCTILTSISLPNSIKTISENAFEGCTGLTNITIPGSVTSIGEYAFYGCTNLTSITIPGSVTSIGRFAFSGCTNLTSITIPGSVTSIGEYAFSGCTNLTTIYYKGNAAGEKWGAPNATVIRDF